MRTFSKQKNEVKNSLQKTRKMHKMTQEELAQAVGVTRQTIISIEKGTYSPSLHLTLKLAKQFNTTVEEIFSL